MRYYFVMLLATTMLCIAGCGDDNDGGSNSTGSDAGRDVGQDAENGGGWDTGQDTSDSSAFPAIVDLTVDPSTMTVDQAASTDFSVQIVINDGFEGAITEADAFIQLGGDRRVTNRGSFDVSGHTIELIGVNEAWFQGLDPGDYAIGASVATDRGESVSQLDLATVTVTE